MAISLHVLSLVVNEATQQDVSGGTSDLNLDLADELRIEIWMIDWFFSYSSVNKHKS
jgi:hypothetical protein